MTNILDSEKNTLYSKHLSSFMFANCVVGSPVHVFKSNLYAQSWTRNSKRDPDDSCYPKKKNNK